MKLGHLLRYIGVIKAKEQGQTTLKPERSVTSMPRRKSNARQVKRKGKKIKLNNKVPKICWEVDDGLRPGRIVAAADYVEVRHG